MKSQPDDATLVALRNRFGLGSILRLDDHPATRPFAEPIGKSMAEAAHKYATQPERITRFVGELTKSPEEQDYAVRHLREAGPAAVPFCDRCSFAARRLSPTSENFVVAIWAGLIARRFRPCSPRWIVPTRPWRHAAASALGMIGDKAPSRS